MVVSYSVHIGKFIWTVWALMHVCATISATFLPTYNRLVIIFVHAVTTDFQVAMETDEPIVVIKAGFFIFVQIIHIIIANI